MDGKTTDEEVRAVAMSWYRKFITPNFVLSRRPDHGVGVTRSDGRFVPAKEIVELMFRRVSGEEVYRMLMDYRRQRVNGDQAQS